MLKTSEEPVDVQELQYKLQSRFKVFTENDQKAFSKHCSLVATASKYGLLFVGTNSQSFQVIFLKSFEENSEVKEDYSRRNIKLPSPPQHLSTNCDNTILAVVIEKDSCPTVLFYEIQSFLKLNVSIIKEIRLSVTPGVHVLEINWNPAISQTFTACKSDGSLGVYEVNGDSVQINELPVAASATCFCWSPKGKQIAVGSRDGKITHYKPDLKAVKIIPAPPLKEVNPLISLQWISNYQFMGVFKPTNPAEECLVIIIDAPKTGDPTFTNFFDICYSSGSSRPQQFYSALEQHWNIMMLASSNSMEVGILGSSGDKWKQWIMADSARAELPLADDHGETCPIGLAIDTSSVQPVQWGESTLQPAPCLLILSNRGVLCCFKIINLINGAAVITAPPEQIRDQSGITCFTTEVEGLQKPPTIPKVSSTQIQPNIKSNQTTPLVITPIKTDVPKPLFGGQSSPFAVAASAQSVPWYGGQISITPVTKPTQNVPVTSSSAIVPAVSKETPNLPLFGGQVTVAPVQKGVQNTSIFGGQSSNTPVTKSTQYVSLFGGQSAITPVVNPTQNVSPFGGQSTMMAKTNPNNPLVSGQATMSPMEAAKPTNTSQAGSFLLSNINKTEVPLSQITGGGQLSNKINIPSTVTQAAPVSIIPITINQTNSSTEYLQVSVPTEVIVQDDDIDSEEIEAMFGEMVREECTLVNNEINVILHEGKLVEVNLNSVEMERTISGIQNLQEFIDELVETSQGQMAEVHLLKQNTIQSWAWLEEARSRNNESHDQQLHAILKSSPLDSVSEKHLHDIQRLTYYLESQLMQAHCALDEQWDNFQEYCRKVNRLQTPTMETIFQTMVKQNVILQRQGYILKDLSNRVKNTKRTRQGPPLFNMYNRDMSLDEHCEKLHTKPEDVCHMYYERVLKRVKSMSATKTNNLRNMLNRNELRHVPVKTELTSVLKLTPDGKKKLFGSSTPIPKKEAVRNLSFFQSTPNPMQGNNAYGKTKEITHTIPSSPISAFAPTNSTSGYGIIKTIPISTMQPNQISSKTGSQEIKTLGHNTLNSFGTQQKTVLNLNVAPVKSQPNLIHASPKEGPKTQTFGSLPNAGSDSKVGFLQSANSLPKQAFVFNTSSSASLFSSTNPQSPLFTPVSSAKASNKTITANPVPVTTSQSIFGGNLAVSAGTDSIFRTSSIKPEPGNIFAGATSNSSDTVLAKTSVPSTNSNSPFNQSSDPKPFNFGQSSVFNKPDSFSLFATNNARSTGDAADSDISKKPSIFSNSAKTTKISATEVQPLVTASSLPPITSPTSATPIFSGFGGGQTLTGKSSTSTIPSDTNTISTAVFGSPQTKSIAVSSSSPGTTSSSFFPPGDTLIKNPASSISSPATQSTLFNVNPKTLPIKPLVSITPVVIPPSLPATKPAQIISIPLPQAAPLSALSTVNSSIFGTAASTPTTQPSISGSGIPVANSIFSSAVQSTTVPSSTFGNVDSIPITQPSIFASTATSQPSLFAAQPSVFGSGLPNATTQSSIFGGASSNSTSPMASSSTTQPPLFGSSAITTQASIFGGTAPSTQGSPFASTVNKPVFGEPAPSTQSSIFSNVTPTNTTQSSLFGAPATSTTQPSIFGQANTSLFGVTTSSGESQPIGTNTSLFSSGTVPDSSGTSSIFATKSNTSPFANFGNASQSGSIFGGTAPTTTTQSIFGNPAATNASSAFGAPINNSPSFGVASPFGNSTVSTASPFGTSAFGSTNNSTNVFGQSNTFNTTQSNFGSGGLFSAAPPTTGSTFGQPAAFASGSLFGGTPTTAANVFGATPTTSSGFGSGSIFGAPSSTAAPFGGGAPGGAFGAPQSSVFGAPTSSSGSGGAFGFGSLNVDSTTNSTFQQGPTQNPFGKGPEVKPAFGSNVFGGSASPSSAFNSPPSIFGNNTQTSASFGSGGSLFGQPSFGNNTFDNRQPGPFSGGSGSVAQSGFGSAQAFSKPAGFGSPPSFGATAGFGSAPSFGGSPSFGSSVFGSPNKVFGSGGQPGAFGSPQPQQNSAFGNLANQNTIGFGNLAQQSTNSPSQASGFSGNSSFSSWR